MIKNIQGFLSVVFCTLLTTLYFNGCIVYETENAVRLSFIPFYSRKIQRQFIEKPGVYFTIPFWSKIIKWNKNTQYTLCKSVPLSYLKEKNETLVDIGITWRVIDTIQYSFLVEKNYPQPIFLLRNWLDDFFKKRYITHHSVNSLKEYLIQQASSKGIEVIDCHIIQKVPTAVSRKMILKQMISMQEKSMQQVLKESQKHIHLIKNRINSQKTIDLTRIDAKAERIRQEGILTATRLYNEAYKKNPRFALIYQRLKSYERGFANQASKDTVVFNTDESFSTSMH